MTGRDRHVGDFGPGARPVEWVLGVYLCLTAALFLCGIGRLSHALPIGLAHLVGVVILVALARRGSTMPRAAGLLRRIMPLAIAPVFYLEIGALNDLIWEGRAFDAWIVGVERGLFGADVSQVFVRAWPWGWWSELVHAGYASYYALPLALFVVLALRRQWADLEWSLTVLAFTFTSCQIWFVLLPVEGPYHVFGPLDPPAPGGVAPPIVNAIVAAGSSVGTAFPSSHVAVAVAVLACARKTHRPTGRVMAVLVTLLAVGTVYGGFHYLVDTLAGVVWGMVSYALGARLHWWLDRRCRTVRSTPSRATDVSAARSERADRSRRAVPGSPPA